MSEQNKKMKQEKVRFPISAKLVMMISFLLIIALGTITLLVTWFGSEDVQITAEENNRTVNAQAANSVESELSSIRANAFLLLDLINTAESSSSFSKRAATFYFERNPSVAAVLVTDSRRSDGVDRTLLNTTFFLAHELDPSLVETFLTQERETSAQVEQGIMKILNAAPLFNQPMLVLFYPYKEKGLSQGLAVFFSAEKLSDSFGQGTLQTTYLVNDTGDVLIHSDFDLIRRGTNVASFPLFTQMRENGDTNRQILFQDETGKKYFGSYTRLSLGDAAVLTTAEAAQVLEPVNDTAKRNLYLSIAVLALSAMFVWFVSKTISTPIKQLTVAAHQIEAGEYELDLKPKTRDEVGLLTSSFVQMGKGLADGNA